MRPLIAILAWLSCLPVHAQFGMDPSDPRTRRAERERAVARVGDVARPLVEEHDAAVRALAACSPGAGRKLAEWHADAAGGLNRLPRPNDFLAAMGDRRRGGDEPVLWAIEHGRELRDPDAFEAFLADPLEYALGLKPLAQGAAEYRSRRLAAEFGWAWWPPGPEIRGVLYACGGIAGLALVVWLARRRRGGSAAPAVRADPPPGGPVTGHAATAEVGRGVPDVFDL